MKKIPKNDPRAQKMSSDVVVDSDGLAEYLHGKHHWVLATTRADGRPQMSLVTGAMVPSSLNGRKPCRKAMPVLPICSRRLSLRLRRPNRPLRRPWKKQVVPLPMGAAIPTTITIIIIKKSVAGERYFPAARFFFFIFPQSPDRSGNWR